MKNNNNNEMKFAVGTMESGLYKYFRTETEAYEFYLQEVAVANEQNAQLREEMSEEEYESFMKDTLPPCDFIFYRALNDDDFESSDDDSDEDGCAAVMSSKENGSRVIGYILNAPADLKCIAVAARFTHDDHPYKISTYRVSHSAANVKKALFTQPVSFHKSGVYTFHYVPN